MSIIYLYSVGQFVFHPPSRIFFHLKDMKFPGLYPLIRHPRRPFALGRGKILILGFIRTPTTLAVYGVAHSLPLKGVDRDFPFTEDKT
jgi:hypothetical protein